METLQRPQGSGRDRRPRRLPIRSGVRPPEPSQRGIGRGQRSVSGSLCGHGPKGKMQKDVPVAGRDGQGRFDRGHLLRHRRTGPRQARHPLHGARQARGDRGSGFPGRHRRCGKAAGMLPEEQGTGLCDVRDIGLPRRPVRDGEALCRRCVRPHRLLRRGVLPSSFSGRPVPGFLQGLAEERLPDVVPDARHRLLCRRHAQELRRRLVPGDSSVSTNPNGFPTRLETSSSRKSACSERRRAVFPG